MAVLDDRDVRMLAILQKEGRISVTALAERIALSPSACHDRMRKLEQSGVIEGYGARIARDALRPQETIFMMVELQMHRTQDFSRFEAAIADVPQIIGCWAVGGGIDYLLRVVADDIDAYQRLADRLLEAEIGIARYFTYVLTKTVKEMPPQFLSAQADVE